MKKFLLYIFLAITAMPAIAQDGFVGKDSTTFKGYIYNKKYNVYIRMDFYNNSITVPYQEIYGQLPGFFGDMQDGRKWLFTDATIKNEKTAILQIINDYGSEDLTATLTQINDSTYRLKQVKGSTIKIARNRKWVKMPGELDFIKNQSR